MVAPGQSARWRGSKIAFEHPGPGVVRRAAERTSRAHLAFKPRAQFMKLEEWAGAAFGTAALTAWGQASRWTGVDAVGRGTGSVDVTEYNLQENGYISAFQSTAV
jgi:hypothetical protein